MTAEAVRPFRIDIADAVLDRISARVDDFDWNNFPDAGDWGSGISVADMRHIVDHWRQHFDWRAVEARLNALPQYLATIDGIDIHYAHKPGTRPGRALVLVNGWPSSFLEFAGIVDSLTDPADPADAFDVIIPSLPGYGFGGRPAGPIGPHRTAMLLHTLVTQVLGYDEYIAHGGDWGASVIAWLGADYPDACKALHFSAILITARDQPAATKEEIALFRDRQSTWRKEGAYAMQQSSMPQTLGFGMSDSPVGAAAWIIEKLIKWSDVPMIGDAPQWRGRIDLDFLVGTVMVYLVTHSFVTATWMYRGRILEGSTQLPDGTRIAAPTAVAVFHEPIFEPLPKSLVERTYNVVRWTQMPAGGHFPAQEQPDLLVRDLQAFARDHFPAAA